MSTESVRVVRAIAVVGKTIGTIIVTSIRVHRSVVPTVVRIVGVADIINVTPVVVAGAVKVPARAVVLL